MAVDELNEYVKRYMKLEHALDALKSENLVLPNPKKWDDSNDQEFVELYRKHVAAKSVYAMCCTMSAERYHHWRIFTEKTDTDGVCIEFKRVPLERALNRIENIRAERVDYVSLKSMREVGRFRPEQLPFIKRNGFRDEREWRILATSDAAQRALLHIPYDPSWIHRIILNPWMDEEKRESTRARFKPLLQQRARVTSSFLTNSPEWKQLGRRLLQ